jgi:peptidoglycan LD-endopeptidase CwlK
MDSNSEERLTQVHPALAKAIRALATMLEARGIIIRVVQGLRDTHQQAALYAQGRTTPGQVVTNAPAGHSWHEFGLAVDCMVGLRGVTPWKQDDNGDSPDYKAMEEAGQSLGLISGACWHHPDKPHFQLAGIPVSPDDHYRALIAHSGLAGVWQGVPA